MKFNRFIINIVKDVWQATLEGLKFLGGVLAIFISLTAIGWIAVKLGLHVCPVGTMYFLTGYCVVMATFLGYAFYFLLKSFVVMIIERWREA